MSSITFPSLFINRLGYYYNNKLPNTLVELFLESDIENVEEWPMLSKVGVLLTVCSVLLCMGWLASGSLLLKKIILKWNELFSNIYRYTDTHKKINLIFWQN